MKWQLVALLLAAILATTGTLTYTDLFGALFQLNGVEEVHTGNISCGRMCESYINVTTSYWRICFANYTDTKYGAETLFKKVSRSRTLHVNLGKVDNIIITEPPIKVDWLVPTYGSKWRPIKDGDCWDRGKINKIKLVGHKEQSQTVKWSFLVGEYVNVDPIWDSVPYEIIGDSVLFDGSKFNSTVIPHTAYGMGRFNNVRTISNKDSNPQDFYYVFEFPEKLKGAALSIQKFGEVINEYSFFCSSDEYGVINPTEVWCLTNGTNTSVITSDQRWFYVGDGYGIVYWNVSFMANYWKSVTQKPQHIIRNSSHFYWKQIHLEPGEDLVFNLTFLPLNKSGKYNEYIIQGSFGCWQDNSCDYFDAHDPWYNETEVNLSYGLTHYWDFREQDGNFTEDIIGGINLSVNGTKWSYVGSSPDGNGAIWLNNNASVQYIINASYLYSNTDMGINGSANRTFACVIKTPTEAPAADRNFFSAHGLPITLIKQGFTTRRLASGDTMSFWSNSGDFTKAWNNFDGDNWWLWVVGYDGTYVLNWDNATDKKEALAGLNTLNGPFLFGMWNSGGRNANVTVDACMIWNRALNQSEVDALWNSGSFTFYEEAPPVDDDTTPIVIVDSPINATNYLSMPIELNYNVTDNIAVDKCWYTNYTGVNESLPSCDNITFSVPNGEHTIIVWVNDTSNNMNSSKIIFRANVSATQTITLNFSTGLEDSFITSNSVDSNYGTSAFMGVTNGTRRYWGIIKWDITLIPDGATINDATMYLTLAVNNLDNGEAITADIYRIMQFPFYNISDADWTDITITWDNQPANSQLNSSIINSTYFDNDFPTDSFYNFSITAAVAEEVAQNSPNMSLLIKATTVSGSPGNVDYLYFSTEDSAVDSIKPFLNITYTTLVDEIAPIISNVNNFSVTNESVLINWTTDEAANRSLLYGLTEGGASDWAHNDTFGTYGVVPLIDLVNGTRYFYNVSSCDALANCNASFWFNFTTDQHPIPAADTCTYGGSGDHEYDCGDNCAIEVTDFLGNNVVITNAGTFTGVRNITNAAKITIINGCSAST